MEKLNEMETKVFEAVKMAIKNENGEFGQTKDVRRHLVGSVNLSDRQINGYLSSLSQKKVISIGTEGVYKGQLTLLDNEGLITFPG